MIETKNKEQAKSLGMDFRKDEVQKKMLAGAATEGKKALEMVTKDLEQIVARHSAGLIDCHSFHPASGALSSTQMQTLRLPSVEPWHARLIHCPTTSSSYSACRVLLIPPG